MSPRDHLPGVVASLEPVIRGVADEDLGAATPCADFDVRAVANHLLGTLEAMRRIGVGEDLDPEDPWMQLHKDRAGFIRLPGGAAFGTWESAIDLALATNADKACDLSLSPMANAITDTSAELILHASHSWEEAQAFLLSNCIMDNNLHHPFEAAEDAVRWALARRRAYAIEGDGFFPITAAAWANRATRVVASEPWDEARMLRLRHGAAVQEGSYFKLR